MLQAEAEADVKGPTVLNDAILYVFETSRVGIGCVEDVPDPKLDG